MAAGGWASLLKGHSQITARMLTTAADSLHPRRITHLIVAHVISEPQSPWQWLAACACAWLHLTEGILSQCQSLCFGKEGGLIIFPICLFKPLLYKCIFCALRSRPHPMKAWWHLWQRIALRRAGVNALSGDRCSD